MSATATTLPSAAAVPVVDTRAARTAQAFVALLVTAAALAGDWRLLAVPALHLVLSAALGRPGNLPVRAFDAWVRPRLATASLEDARPPRFANVLGATFLAASLLAHAAGTHALGWALAAAVAALAALGATTGLCIGCRLYWAIALLRRARSRLGARGA
jgi:hypothetical protein